MIGGLHSFTYRLAPDVAPLLLALRALMNRYTNCSRCGDFKDLWLAGAQASCWLPASHPLRLTPEVTQNYLHPQVGDCKNFCV